LPIYHIKSLTCGYVQADEVKIYPVEITQYVYESTHYFSQLSSFKPEGDYLRINTKETALYYTIGEKNIKGLFYKAPDAKNTATYSYFSIVNILFLCTDDDDKTRDYIKDLIEGNPTGLVFNIEYIPMCSATVSHEKQLYTEGHKYTQIYNQSENMVEAQYFGENVKGVAARLGNVEKERTYILDSYSSLPKVGQMLDGYAISALNVEVMPYHLKCTLGLSKDFNRISEYVGVSSIKRLYEVSERQVYNRDILLKEYLLITSDQNQTSDDKCIGGVLGFFDSFANDAYNLKTQKITAVVTKGRSENNNEFGNRIVLPVTNYSLGNTAIFSFSFKDNYSAGISSKEGLQIDENSNNITGRWQIDEPYSDYWGRIHRLDFYLFAPTVDNGVLTLNHPYTLPLIDDDKISTNPLEPISKDVLYGVTYARSTKEDGNSLLLEKDSRETISITYEIEAKTDVPDLVIGPALMEQCRYTGGDKRLCLVVFNSEFTGSKFDRYYALRGDETIRYENFVSEDSNSFTLKTVNGIILTHGCAFIAPNEDGTGGEIALLYTGKETSLNLKFVLKRN
jgi:hypothetical protein